MYQPPTEVFSKYPNKQYPLLDALYRAGYRYQGLRRLLRNPNAKGPLAAETLRSLLTEDTGYLTAHQLFMIAGLLGCHITDVLDLIAHSPQKDLRTAQALRNGKIRHPDSRLDKRIFGHQLKQDDIPLPGWLNKE